jgi:hypothetical protein
MSAAAKLTDHIQDGVYLALRKFSVYDLTVNDLKAFGFEGYDDIVVELRKLSLPIPTRPRTLADPSIQEMRSKAFDDLLQSTHDHQTRKRLLNK